MSFHYAKAKNNEKAIGVMYSVMSSSGVDTSFVGEFDNLSWKTMELPKVRDDLNKICNIARTIKHRYEESLLALGNAEYTSGSKTSRGSEVD